MPIREQPQQQVLQQQPQHLVPTDETSQMGQNGGLTNEIDTDIRDAINQHLPEVVSAVISMMNNQGPSAPRDVQPQELRDNERLNEPGNYSNVVSSNTYANRLTDTNVNIGLGPNPLVSFSTTGQPSLVTGQLRVSPLTPVEILVGI